MRKNTFIKIIAFLFVASIITGAFVFLKYKDTIKNPLVKTHEDFVLIDAKKDTLSGVIIDNEEVFKGKLFIKIYNKLNKVSISVKRGIYEIPVDSSLEDIIKYLEEGKYNTSVVNVTIPEGFTIDKIANLLDDKGVVKKEDFIKECENYNAPSFVKTNSNKRYRLEGYLFPDTYRLEKGMNSKDIIDIMINRFEDILSQIKSENNIDIDEDDIENIVIKASMIERETKNDDEKPLVASVINNRLKINMKLQIDATVLYAMGEHKDKLYLSDLKYKSPYNTYYTEGLPVGAISNPGKEALKAAAIPGQSNYIYYMTKDGYNHKFFDNYNDFIKYKNS